MPAEVRAWCPECKKWVSDELISYGDGKDNKHEHEVVLFSQLGTLPSGAVLQSVVELSMRAYLEDASKMDAELIVNRISAEIKKKYGWGIPEGFIKSIVEEIVKEVLKVAREYSIKEEGKDREKKKLSKGKGKTK